MILYEVNLKIQKDIIADYDKWLHAHIAEILQIDGFEKASWWKEVESKDEKVTYTIHYFLKDKTAMNSYLKNHAPRLRQEGIDKFGGKFEATRRIFELKKAY